MSDVLIGQRKDELCYKTGMEKTLKELGFVPFFSQQVAVDDIECGRIGRVVEVQRSQITVSDGSNELSIPLTSNVYSGEPEDRPTVGDWVRLDEQQQKVEQVLNRKSVFRRLASGENSELQLIAANVDVLFIVTSCNDEFKESRLERYLALAVEAGVVPVVVLTKMDLSDDPDSFVKRARKIQAGVAVEPVNALDEGTFAGLKAWIDVGSTIGVVGSSGVGKSTILNSLMQTPIAATSGIREHDTKGRHTTTHRALYKLPDGGLLIDVPGIRELKVSGVDDALAVVFDDIEALASNCRFADCVHQNEPGCAVLDAVKNGKIEERRWRNYLKLQLENERNSASLAEKRLKGRNFAKLVQEAKAIKKGVGINN